jgi:hypothetical protein
MGSARAVFIEGGPNSDGAYLKITDGEMHLRTSVTDREKQERIIALLEAILAELKKR